MKLPRSSLHSIMFGLFVVAVDCVIYRSIQLRPESMVRWLSLSLLATLPMANLLYFAVASLIRGPGGARAPHVGFTVGACLALVVTILGLRPALDGIERALYSVGLTRWFMASPARELVFYYTLVAGLPLAFQVGAGLVGKWIGRAVGRRWARAGVEASRPARLRIAALALPVAFVALPALAIEGFLSREVDPLITRMPAGSSAVVDFNGAPQAPLILPKGSPLRQLAGAKVRVEADREPFLIEHVVVRDATSKQERRSSRDRRQVEVMMLDGPKAGESIGIYYCFLRPIR